MCIFYSNTKACWFSFWPWFKFKRRHFPLKVWKGHGMYYFRMSKDEGKRKKTRKILLKREKERERGSDTKWWIEREKRERERSETWNSQNISSDISEYPRSVKTCILLYNTTSSLESKCRFLFFRPFWRRMERSCLFLLLHWGIRWNLPFIMSRP